MLIGLSAPANKVPLVKPSGVPAAPIVGLMVILAACSSSTPPASSPSSTSAPSGGAQTQTSAGGQVTVVVAWAGLSAGAVFDVKLDTHSIDLDAIDLADAVLRNDRGESLTARPWAAPKGGHHREGSLSFDGDASAFFAGTKWIELVIRGVGDQPERTLRWEVGS